MLKSYSLFNFLDVLSTDIHEIREPSHYNCGCAFLLKALNIDLRYFPFIHILFKFVNIILIFLLLTAIKKPIWRCAALCLIIHESILLINSNFSDSLQRKGEVSPKLDPSFNKVWAHSKNIWMEKFIINLICCR